MATASFRSGALITDLATSSPKRVSRSRKQLSCGGVRPTSWQLVATIAESVIKARSGIRRFEVELAKLPAHRVRLPLSDVSDFAADPRLVYLTCTARRRTTEYRTWWYAALPTACLAVDSSPTRRMSHASSPNTSTVSRHGFDRCDTRVDRHQLRADPCANERISIGVIGCGGRGFRAHMPGVHKHDKEQNIEITAVSDPWRLRRERAAACCQEWYSRPARQFVSYRDIMALEDIDAVMIASCDHHHAAHLEAAARAKKDAYCEKPLAMDMESLKKCCDAVKANGIVVQLGTQVRSYSSSTGCRELFRSGAIGKVSRIEQCPQRQQTLLVLVDAASRETERRRRGLEGVPHESAHAAFRRQAADRPGTATVSSPTAQSPTWVATSSTSTITSSATHCR